MLLLLLYGAPFRSKIHDRIVDHCIYQQARDSLCRSPPLVRIEEISEDEDEDLKGVNEYVLTWWLLVSFQHAVLL